jgi:hypothetical protein
MTADFSFDPAKSGIEVSATTRMPRTTALEDRLDHAEELAEARRDEEALTEFEAVDAQLGDPEPVGG